MRLLSPYPILFGILNMLSIIITNPYFKLLTNERKYNDLPTTIAQRMVLGTQLPPINPYLQNSDSVLHVALKSVIRMTLQRYAKNRKSAEEVYLFLAEQLMKDQEKTNVAA